MGGRWGVRAVKFRFQGPALLVWTSKYQPRELQWPSFPEFGAAYLSFRVPVLLRQPKTGTCVSAMSSRHVDIVLVTLRSPSKVDIHQQHHTGRHHEGEVTGHLDQASLNPKP